MNHNRRETPQTAAERVYGLLLRLYPAGHRREYGRLMLQAFRDNYYDRSASQPPVGFWLEVLADVIKSAWSEHWSAFEGGHRLNAIHRHIGVFAGLSLGALSLVLIVWTNVVFPRTESDNEYRTVYLLGYASLLLVFAVIGFWGSRSTNRVLSGTRAGAIAALLGAGIALAAFIAVDNLFLGVVGQQADKIQGFHQSTFPTMRDYVNADLLSAVLIALPVVGAAGAVCGTLGAAVRRLALKYVQAG
jgi:hypothetical protein